MAKKPARKAPMIPAKAMKAWEGSAADKRQDMAGAAKMAKRGGLKRGGKAGC